MEKIYSKDVQEEMTDLESIQKLCPLPFVPYDNDFALARNVYNSRVADQT